MRAQRALLVLSAASALVAAAPGCTDESSPPGGSGGETTGGGSAGEAPAGGSSGATSGGAPSGGSATGGGAGAGSPASGGAAGSAGAATGGAGNAAGTGGSGGAAGGGGSAGSAAGGSAGTAGSGETGIRIDGRRVLVDGAPYHARGVCWNPVPRGGSHPADLDYAGLGEEDIPLMQAAGINTVRTYEPLLDTAVLDRLFAAGIRVLNSVYPYGGDPASVVTERVNAVKDHPAILGWVLGNEWNYNGLYVGLSHAESLARLNEAAELVDAADGTHPVVSVYGELPAADTLAAMPGIDIWGINAYRGLSFGDLFTVWAGRSDQPMFLSEYGADAYNANLPGYDPTSQAEATRALTEELLANSSALTSDGVAFGGTIFEWADEWWKAENPDAQDTGGAAPGGGPHPDQVFNEEWWGIVDIDRNPRPAYDELAELYGR